VDTPSACAFASESGGLGDLGYCAELCNCDDDCNHEAFICEAFPKESLKAELGFQGICTAPVDTKGGSHVGATCPTTSP
jgi:hypothetical protein